MWKALEMSSSSSHGAKQGSSKAAVDDYDELKSLGGSSETSESSGGGGGNHFLNPGDLTALAQAKSKPHEMILAAVRVLDMLCDQNQKRMQSNHYHEARQAASLTVITLLRKTCLESQIDYSADSFNNDNDNDDMVSIATHTTVESDDEK
jgi:hypothetical protein